MKIDKSFAGKAKNVDEAPEPFRQNLREQIKSDEAVSLLVYSPVFKSAGRRFDATVVAVTNERWLMLAEEENGNVKVSGASFDDTLARRVDGDLVVWSDENRLRVQREAMLKRSFNSTLSMRKCIARPLTSFSMQSKE